MKILIPVFGFGRTGGYRVLSELASAWIKQGHSVDFLCLGSSPEPYFPTSGKIIRIDRKGKLSNENNGDAKLSRFQHLKALYKGLNLLGPTYNVILANHSLTAWPVGLASCGDAKKIYYVQAYEPEYYSGAKTLRGYLFGLVSALTYHLPLEKIVNSPIYFKYKNLRSSFYVPPGLDLDNFRPSLSAKENLKDSNIVVIGCIGRSEPEKGTVYVLRAFEMLYAKDQRYRLRIAAFGDLPDNWTHEKCELIVPKNDMELADYYRGLDILVAPGTVQHGAPHYPVLEAGACGIPVITTGYMGATDDTAWIVPNRDAKSIANAVEVIVSDNQSVRKRVDRFLADIVAYSWNNVATKMSSQFR